MEKYYGRKKYTLEESHKKFGVDLYNKTWEFIDKEKRSQAEIDIMIHAAHASRYHWGEFGEPVNFARGEWQISRVYSILKMSESALFHAKRCLDICKENEIGDFDLAFAYEALARAYSIINEDEEFKKYYHLAEEAGDKIKLMQDKDYFFSELKNISS